MAGKCILVRNNKSLARIVLQKDTLKAAKEAVHEFQTGVAKAAGVRIGLDYSELDSFTLEHPVSTPVSIRFNIISDRPELFGKDGFCIRIEKDKIFFEAKTKFGLLNAVYSFLRRYCGFVWLWPGKDGEVYDTNNLNIPLNNISMLALMKELNDDPVELSKRIIRKP